MAQPEFSRQIAIATDSNVDPLVGKHAVNSNDCKEYRDLEMLNEHGSTMRSEDNSDWHESETLDIRAIIQECVNLPLDVTNAKLTNINERVLDQRLLSFLVSQRAPQDSDPEWVVRRRNRKEALSPYLGRVLICVFIRLPGVHYTIELDPELQRVAHWEWQTN